MAILPADDDPGIRLRIPSPRHFQSWIGLWVALFLSVTFLPSPAFAQNTQSLKYSPTIVAKANRILSDAGLQWDGKSWQLHQAPKISEANASLNELKASIEHQRKAWNELQQKLDAVRTRFGLINQQQGKLGQELAEVAGIDVTANNRIVGLMEANRANMQKLADDRERLKAQIDETGQQIAANEHRFATGIESLRRLVTSMRAQLEKALQERQVKIALNVMHVNRGAPTAVSAENLLRPLEADIEMLEAEIIRDAVPLRLVGQSLYATVMIGQHPVSMVVDSGAEMVCLTMDIAKRIGLDIPTGAPTMRLVLANGESIPARAVTIDRMQLGRFVLHDVPAAILDASADHAEPLLGLSFLGRFKFEIDRRNRKLTMTEIAPSRPANRTTENIQLQPEQNGAQK